MERKIKNHKDTKIRLKSFLSFVPLWFSPRQKNEVADNKGSAIVIVALLLSLLTVYISASLITATTDAISSNFEVAQQRAFYTAYSKMEQMSRDFSTLFITAVVPKYVSICGVVMADPTSMNGFRIEKPDVGAGPTYTPNYSTKYIAGTNLLDLGWAGSNPRPFCYVD